MFKIVKSSEFEPKPGEHWIEVYQPISGWKAIEYWAQNEKTAKEEDLPVGFVEPWQTGSFPHATKDAAWKDAKIWAEGEELPVVVPDDEYEKVLKL